MQDSNIVYQDSPQLMGPIKDFLSNFVGDFDLSYDDNIFELGLVNSLVALDLLQFLEREFQIEVPTDALRIENFSSVEMMARMVIDLRKAQSDVK